MHRSARGDDAIDGQPGQVRDLSTGSGTARAVGEARLAHCRKVHVGTAPCALPGIKQMPPTAAAMTDLVRRA